MHARVPTRKYLLFYPAATSAFMDIHICMCILVNIFTCISTEQTCIHVSRYGSTYICCADVASACMDIYTCMYIILHIYTCMPTSASALEDWPACSLYTHSSCKYTYLVIPLVYSSSSPLCYILCTTCVVKLDLTVGRREVSVIFDKEIRWWVLLRICLRFSSRGNC